METMYTKDTASIASNIVIIAAILFLSSMAMLTFGFKYIADIADTCQLSIGSFKIYTNQDCQIGQKSPVTEEGEPENWEDLANKRMQENETEKEHGNDYKKRLEDSRNS